MYCISPVLSSVLLTSILHYFPLVKELYYLADSVMKRAIFYCMVYHTTRHGSISFQSQSSGGRGSKVLSLWPVWANLKILKPASKDKNGKLYLDAKYKVNAKFS